MTADRPLIVLTACPDQSTADAIARKLVEDRLAACVSRTAPIHSLFRWQGAVEEAEECLLVIKTRGDRLGDLMQAVASLHPYEVPEILAVPVETGWPPYLSWLAGMGDPLPEGGKAPG